MYTVVRTVRENSNGKRRKKNKEAEEKGKEKKRETEKLFDTRITLVCTLFIKGRQSRGRFYAWNNASKLDNIRASWNHDLLRDVSH